MITVGVLLMNADKRKNLRVQLMFKSGIKAKVAASLLLKANVPLENFEANRIAELLLPIGKKPRGQLKVNHYFWAMTAQEIIDAGGTKTSL
jgi:hypothetical protein